MTITTSSDRSWQGRAKNDQYKRNIPAQSPKARSAERGKRRERRKKANLSIETVRRAHRARWPKSPLTPLTKDQSLRKKWRFFEGLPSVKIKFWDKVLIEINHSIRVSWREFKVSNILKIYIIIKHIITTTEQKSPENNVNVTSLCKHFFSHFLGWIHV